MISICPNNSHTQDAVEKERKETKNSSGVYDVVCWCYGFCCSPPCLLPKTDTESQDPGLVRIKLTSETNLFIHGSLFCTLQQCLVWDSSAATQELIIQRHIHRTERSRGGPRADDDIAKLTMAQHFLINPLLHDSRPSLSPELLAKTPRALFFSDSTRGHLVLSPLPRVQVFSSMNRVATTLNPPVIIT
jgi:hypothetical protein